MTSHGLPPAGTPLTITYGKQSCVVTPSGATLRSYLVGDRPVIESFNGPESPVVGCQGEVLAPWPNRVVDGRWTWRDIGYQLSITEPERGHALHGLVRNMTWTVVAQRDNSVTLEVLLLAQPGWPFPLSCTIEYALDAAGLRSTLKSTNVGFEACPYGAAVHPYIALPTRVDEVVLHVPAATWVETNERLAPLARRPTAGTAYDFTDGTLVGGRQVDTAFTDLVTAPDGRVEARVTTPDGVTTLVWGDRSVRWWQIYTADTLPAPWYRGCLAVEPMTCAPDALNSGDGLVILEPGESHSVVWGLTLL